MHFFSKIEKSTKQQPSPQQLESFPNDKKKKYIFEKFYQQSQQVLNEIKRQFERKCQHGWNVCFERYPSDVQQFTACAQNLRIKGQQMIDFSMKKMFYVSVSTQKCLFTQNKPVTQCKDLALDLTKSIMEQQLSYFRSWNPNI